MTVQKPSDVITGVGVQINTKEPKKKKKKVNIKKNSCYQLPYHTRIAVSLHSHNLHISGVNNNFS